MREILSLKYRVTYPLVIFLLCLGGFIIFSVGAISLVTDIMMSREMVLFKKIVFVAFGSSLALLGFLWQAYYEVIKQINMPKHIAAIVVRLWLSGVVIMVVLPFAAHFFVKNIIYDKGYYYCSEARYESLKSQINFYYVKDEKVCLDVVAEKSRSFTEKVSDLFTGDE
ncbi:MAG: hypothetical protein CMD81_10690 [Gammaproteobacteria bacterium]|nr:hypothetical protein [Gammaproteobacteria bacterium]HBF06886.1 hypothetical protein [Gammaproteobacteria bacterium]|tara:strand:- start:185 stop:688 length:504 start_codon:yes stop_codon:yes gene_type:complete